jgi:hypothetical protein
MNLEIAGILAIWLMPGERNMKIRVRGSWVGQNNVLVRRDRVRRKDVFVRTTVFVIVFEGKDES